MVYAFFAACLAYVVDFLDGCRDYFDRSTPEELMIDFLTLFIVLSIVAYILI